MKDDGIEDILIGANYNNSNKKGKKGIIIIFILLLIVLVGLIIAYNYFTKQTVSQKEAFIKHMSNVNIQNLLSNNVYDDIFNRLLTENYQSNSNLNFSTNMESEELEDVDISKLSLNLTSSNDSESLKTYNEFKLTYSGNEIFKMNMLSDKTGIALFADEITDKYLGVHYDKFKDIFGVEYDNEKINELKNVNKIDLSENEKKEYTKKYLDLLTADLTEENFSTQENIAIEKDSDTVNVTAYTLTLTQEEFKDIIIKTLNEFKNDEELLEKLIIDSENLNDKEKESIEDEDIEIEDIENENIEDENVEDTDIDEDVVDIDNQEEELGEEETLENPLDKLTKTLTSAVTPDLEINNTDESIEESNVEIAEENSMLSNFINILLGKKADTTIDTIKKDIDQLINQVEKPEGNGLVITVYASEEKTEKISITMPNENTVDIEFLDNSENENHIKLTYLYNGNNSIFKNISNDDVLIYSGEDLIDIEENVPEDQINGFSLEISKVQKEANTTIDAVYSFIEDKSINKKISLNINTNGRSNSSSYTNDVIITFSTNEGETKVVIDNNITFGGSYDIDDLTEDNCLYLDELNSIELTTTLQATIFKILEVYDSKKEEFKFLDTNVHASTIDRASTAITIDEARDALINRVSIMMRETIDRNEEFTIQNLENLTIDGYEVSSTVSEEEAIIVVDVYTFRIDSEFSLTDVE